MVAHGTHIHMQANIHAQKRDLKVYIFLDAASGWDCSLVVEPLSGLDKAPGSIPSSMRGRLLTLEVGRIVNKLHECQ